MKRPTEARKFRSYAMTLTCIVLAISAAFTLFSVLDYRYRMEHYSPAFDNKVPAVQSKSQYSLPAQVMTYVSLLVPLMAIGFSLSFFRTTVGRPLMRYLKAFGLSCLVFPLMALQYLPWTIYQTSHTPGYLQFDEFQVVLDLLPLYAACAVLVSLGINGVAWLRERWTTTRT
ncbi:MAG TPA: hypothetical protein VIV60_01625 [Polyangiaceae bacterium]